MSEKPVLELITRLTYNLEGLPNGLKLYLNQFLTFHFSKTLSIDVIQNVENEKAGKGYRNGEEISEATKTFSREEKAWCVAVLYQLKNEAERLGYRKLAVRSDNAIEQITGLFNLAPDNGEIERQGLMIRNELVEFRNRRVIRISIRMWPLVIDFILRSVLLFAGTFFGFSWALIPLNIVVVSPVILLVAFIVSRRDKKLNKQALEIWGAAHQFRIEYVVTVRQATLLAVFLAAIVFTTYLSGLGYIFLFACLIMYYFIYIRFLRVGRIDENELLTRLHSTETRTQKFDADRNDEEIVQVETKLNSFTSRLDAYVLESALFGALTFSGFLQIMASDLVSFMDLENFATYGFNTARAVIDLDGQSFSSGIANLSTKVSLLCLVSLESLICSAFFLAVIASRLRFSDVADRVRTSIDLAKAYNTKEEALLADHEPNERQSKRINELTDKVSDQIHTALRAIGKVDPVMMYMRYFRNAGIIAFLTILLTSSLFITSVLGWSFMAIIAVTYAYFNYERINTTIKAGLLITRIQFIRKGYWFLGGAALPIVFGLIVTGTPYYWLREPLMAIGLITTALCGAIWLVLATHIDEQFGDIESRKISTRSSRWRVVKYILAAMTFIYGIGLAFKELHLRGADEMIVLTLFSLSVLMYFVGYYLSKIRWLGIVCGWVLAVASIGVLFKILHATGAIEMLAIAIGGMIILIPVLLLKRKSFHRLFLRFVIVVLIFALNSLLGISHKAELAASHRTFDLDPIMDVATSNEAETLLADPKNVPAGIRKCDWYINTYGVRPGYSNIYRYVARNYYRYMQADSLNTENRQLVANETFKIYSMFPGSDELAEIQGLMQTKNVDSVNQLRLKRVSE